jgi:cytosine/adenosine deaminase-related metal-dependent hydrolase
MARTLIKNASIVTMDKALGDLLPGDILIESDKIVAIGRNLTADGADVVDGTHRIVAPGFINAHMHTWQAALKAVAANWTLMEYFKWVHAGLATQFRPDDIGIANLFGALTQINAGTTTLVDWCHNNPTPEHTDAAVEGLFQSGIRAVFLHGSPKPDPKPGQPHFSEVNHPRSEVERLLKGRFASRDQLVTLGLAILGPHYSTLEVARHDFRMARELGLVASMHQAGPMPKTPGGWDILEADGLIGPYLNIVHATDFDDKRVKRFVDKGVSFSVTPESECCHGHGWPITGRLLAAGGNPTLGNDIETLASADMTTAARMALILQRALDNAQSRERTQSIPATSTVTARQALSWITTEPAKMLGLDSKIGSLAPGKQADLVMVRADDLNIWPAHEPVSSLVMQTSFGNIDSVMIGGTWKKRGGKLAYADLDRAKSRLKASGDRILEAIGYRKGNA